MTVEYLDAKRIQGNYLVGDKAWSFNGGKVTCSFQLLPVGTSDWSISMWIKFNNFTDSDELVREETSNFELWRNSDGMKVVHDSGNVTFVAQASLATDTWYHIVLTNDDGSFKVYWNGDEITSASGTTRTIGTVTTWYLGGRSNDSEAFHGVMDQFLVYTSVLDQTAIDLLYNDGKADRTPSTTNLQTYYNFEQTGTTLEDQAGSNDGSAGGTITTDVDGAISAQDDKATLIIDATSFTTPSFNQYLDYSSYDARPHDVQLKSDGTKMYVMNYQEKEIEQFSLSPAYDISTASSDGTYDVSTYDPSPVGLFIDSSGSHLFVAGRNQNNIDQFSLGTAWDITTGVSHVRTNSTAWGNIWGLTFNPDGTKMYVMDSGEVEQYDLGSAWNITTLSNNETFDPDTQDNNAFDAEWNDDGTALYITGHENDSIYKYTCSTAYSVASSSISYDSVYFAFPTDYHDSSGFCFAKSGQKMYVSTGEATYDRILEYDIGSPVSSNLPENTIFNETDTNRQFWLQDGEWKRTVPTAKSCTLTNTSDFQLSDTTGGDTNDTVERLGTGSYDSSWAYQASSITATNYYEYYVNDVKVYTSGTFNSDTLYPSIACDLNAEGVKWQLVKYNANEVEWKIIGYSDEGTNEVYSTFCGVHNSTTKAAWGQMQASFFIGSGSPNTLQVVERSGGSTNYVYTDLTHTMTIGDTFKIVVR